MVFSGELFKESIRKLSAAVTAKPQMEIMRYVRFADGYASAFDGELGIRVPIDIGCNCGVEGKDILSLIRSLPDDEINIAEVNSKLCIKAGRATLRLNTVSHLSTYDVMPRELSDPISLDLSQQLATCSYGVSYQAHSRLQGIFINRDFTCATDGKIAIYCVHQKPFFDRSVLLPVRSAKVFSKAGESIYRQSTGMVVVEFDGCQFMSSLLDDTKFPAKQLQIYASVPIDQQYCAWLPEGCGDELTKVMSFKPEPGTGLRVQIGGGMISFAAVNKVVGSMDMHFEDFHFPHQLEFNLVPEQFVYAAKTARYCDFSDLLVGNKQRLRLISDGVAILVSLMS